MQSLRRKLTVILAAAVVLAAAAYVVLSVILNDRLTLTNDEGAFNWSNTPAAFKVRRGPYVAFDTTPYQAANYEDVRVPSRDAGVTLAGWYLAGDPSAPAIVVTHGYNRCKCDSNVLTPAGMLHRNGFNVLLIDLRNHGDSTRTNGRAAYGNTEYADVLGAWDWLAAQKGIPPQRVGLYGVSMGAATTLIAFGQEPRVPAAFVDSSPADAKELTEDELSGQGWPAFLSFGGLLAARATGGVDLMAHTPREGIVRDAGRPLYLVHGTTDARVPVRQHYELEALAKQSGANVTNWVVEGAGHVESEFRAHADYEQRLTTFFRSALR